MKVPTDWKKCLPATLALFNIADFKRFNDALGHRNGDLVIERMQSTLALRLRTNERYKRVAGDKWLALLVHDPEDSVQQILKSFSGCITRNFGWTGRAQLGTKTAEVVEVSIVQIRYEARCLFAQVSEPFELVPTADALDNACYGFSPSSAVPLSTVKEHRNVTWRAIQPELEIPNLYCPMCRQIGFKWTGGDSSIYGGEGLCCHCRATVDFTNAVS